MPEENGRTRIPVTIGQVGQNVMKYWPALIIIVAFIGAGAEVRLRVNQHTDALKAIMLKLETSETDKQQWKLLRSLLDDSVEYNGRLKEVEQHITPKSIQLWGQIQATVLEDHEDLKNHLRGHP